MAENTSALANPNTQVLGDGRTVGLKTSVGQILDVFNIVGFNVIDFLKKSDSLTGAEVSSWAFKGHPGTALNQNARNPLKSYLGAPAYKKINIAFGNTETRHVEGFSYERSNLPPEILQGTGVQALNSMSLATEQAAWAIPVLEQFNDAEVRHYLNLSQMAFSNMTAQMQDSSVGSGGDDFLATATKQNTHAAACLVYGLLCREYTRTGNNITWTHSNTSVDVGANSDFDSNIHSRACSPSLGKMFPTWDERPLVIADGSDSANNYVYTPADYTTFKNVWQEPKFKVYEQGIGTNTTPQGAAQRSSVLIPEESSFGLKRDASGNPVAGAPTPTVLRAYHVGKAIELISKRFYNKTAKHNKLTLLLSINDARRFDTFGSINGITTTQRATENIYIPKGDTSENGMVNFRTAPVRVFVDTVMGTIKVMHTPDIGLTRGNPLSYAVAPLAWDAPELVTRGGYALLIDFEDFAVCTNPASQFDLRIEGDQGDYVNIVRGGKYSFQTYSPYITMICNLAV